MKFTKIIGAAIAMSLAAGTAMAQGAIEKPKVILGVGGKALLYYLPLTVAERKGFFKERGLDVEIQDFPDGGRKTGYDYKDNNSTP